MDRLKNLPKIPKQVAEPGFKPWSFQFQVQDSVYTVGLLCAILIKDHFFSGSSSVNREKMIPFQGSCRGQGESVGNSPPELGLCARHLDQFDGREPCLHFPDGKNPQHFTEHNQPGGTQG